MDAKLNGGPAFPTLAVVGDTALSEGGLTVRDCFAAAAMQGICASGPMIADDVIAQEAYAIADAMLAARASGAQPVQPATDADGWIAWYGGKSPAGQDTNVEVVLRSGDVCGGLAGGFYWKWHRDGREGSDIVRYRVVREAKP